MMCAVVRSLAAQSRATPLGSHFFIREVREYLPGLPQKFKWGSQEVIHDKRYKFCKW